MLIVALLEWRGEEKNIPLKIDGRDELNPTDEPNPAPYLWVWAEKNLVPISSLEPDDLAPKLCHLGHHMKWVSVQASP